MIAVIMAGGSGTRFWPLSKESKPKQYLQLFSDKTMLRKTVERLYPVIGPEKIFIVSTASQKELIRKNVPEIPEENLIVEPLGRNTAPCIALSAVYLSGKYSPQENMLVLPSDHVIIEQDVYLASLKKAEEAASKGFLVTFGIKPDYPATGYGYIEAGEVIEENTYRINNFKEKPDYKTAKSFLEAGNYYWNSGMFMWNLETIIESFKQYAPSIIEPVFDIVDLYHNTDAGSTISKIYADIPKQPVDVAIMEKSTKGIVIPVDYHWSDVGSWRAVSELQEKDKNNNTLPEKSLVITSEDNYVHSSKLVALIDVNDLIVVETDDALLIADKASAEKVKDVVELIKKRNWTEYL